MIQKHRTWTLLFCLIIPQSVLAYVHSAPVVIPANKIRAISGYPISMYQVFKTDKSGAAKAIPFQIDEINQIGDYVLDQGQVPNAQTGDKIFNNLDELAFMGDDIGESVAPKSYLNHSKPDLVFELKFTPPQSLKDSREGSVFVGIYFNSKIQLAETMYAVFDPYQGIVQSSRYKYLFDKENYLVVRGIDVFKTPETKTEQVVISSSMFMRADLKYFITLTANHRTLNSTLEAWKQGPVRAIVRVSFFYKFLRLNFELGMYTEVSFFANAVFLPAIMYNPIDGPKSLNSGSGFYYGFALHKNPNEYNFDTNMPYYKERGLFDFFVPANKPQEQYWASITGSDKMFHIEIQQEKSLVELGNIPLMYKESVDSNELKKRSFEKALPLGKSPVNLGMFFDLTRFTKGEHNLGFKLYFENRFNQRDLESFRRINDWDYAIKRL